MAQPKKQSSSRKTALRRSSIVKDLGEKVNAALSHVGSKVRVYTTKRKSGKRTTKK